MLYAVVVFLRYGTFLAGQMGRQVGKEDTARDQQDADAPQEGDLRLQERRAKDFLVVPYPTPPGNAAAYYPETNPLVPLDHVADKSNTPVSKAIVVRLERDSRFEMSS